MFELKLTKSPDFFKLLAGSYSFGKGECQVGKCHYRKHASEPLFDVPKM